MKAKDEKVEEAKTRRHYEQPEIVEKKELIVDLQTNVLPEEPPPPL